MAAPYPNREASPSDGERLLTANACEKEEQGSHAGRKAGGARGHSPVEVVPEVPMGWLFMCVCM